MTAAVRGAHGRPKGPPMWAIWSLSLVASTAIAYMLYEPNSDLLSEWLAARAAREGNSPYLSTTDLARLYGFDYANDTVFPRTPGALLLFQPIGLVPATWLPWVGSVSVAATLVAAASYIHRYAPILVPLVLVTFPGWDTAYHGHISMGILALCAAILVRGDDRAAGIAAGVATVFKLFPGLWVVVLLLMGRWKAVWWAAATFGVLNLIGLGLPGVRVAEIVDGVGDGARWVGRSVNGSLMSFGVPWWLVVAAVVAFLVWWPRQSILRAVVPVSILAGPLAWLPYTFAVLTVIPIRWAAALLVAWVALLIYHPPSFTIGMQALAWCVVGLIALAVATRERSEPRSRH
jgi:hypothetical protein